MKVSWILVISLAVVAAFLITLFFFPAIIKQFAVAIVAGFTFLIGLIFRRKKSAS